MNNNMMVNQIKKVEEYNQVSKDTIEESHVGNNK